jgi:hypothetical protein
MAETIISGLSSGALKYVQSKSFKYPILKLQKVLDEDTLNGLPRNLKTSVNKLSQKYEEGKIKNG